MTSDVVARITAYGLMPGHPLALVVTSGGAVLAAQAGVGSDALAGSAGTRDTSAGTSDAARTWDVPAATAIATVRAIDRELRPRWVWWSAREAIAGLLRAQASGGGWPASSRRLSDSGVTGHRAAGSQLRACWDLAAVHRVLAGGARDDPARVWALATGLAPDRIPSAGQLDLLESTGGTDDDGEPAEPVRPDGYLRPDWAGGAWRSDPARTRRWARLALHALAGQLHVLTAVSCAGDVTLTARAESAAALLAAELEHAGLPIDRAAAEELLRKLIGPRPDDESHARQARAERDNRVLRLAPAAATETDLRNPAQVRSMLARAGVDVPDTRSWRLERYAQAHPVVPALLAWRKTERVATTYGYDWLDRHVSPDGRLRGGWTASDGGAGRMTAQTGLHNLPAEMRAAVAAEPGQLLVRADLGQVEPRVLAAVSGDRALAAAALEDDLYLPVAARIGCTRALAKVAVLAAMYGQTSGAAGQALAGMKRTYPVAIDHLDRADAAGRAGGAMRTYGGRLVSAGPAPAAADRLRDGVASSVAAARGRYLRNAVIQGAAAELFKAWAATVRAELLSGGVGEIVLCLHDELLLQVSADEADRVAASLVPALHRTASTWFAGRPTVRFVASVVIVTRWSDAKE